MHSALPTTVTDDPIKTETMGIFPVGQNQSERGAGECCSGEHDQMHPGLKARVRGEKTKMANDQSQRGRNTLD